MDDKCSSYYQVINFLHFYSAVISFRHLAQATEGDVTIEEKERIEERLKLFKQLLNDQTRQSLDVIPDKQKYSEQQEYIESKAHIRRFINNLNASKFHEDMPHSLEASLHITITEQLYTS
jgi:ribosome-associated translation inhibitor RaiA